MKFGLRAYSIAKFWNVQNAMKTSSRVLQLVIHLIYVTVFSVSHTVNKIDAYGGDNIAYSQTTHP